MRICSLLPSATEIVYALGLGDQLVAVTHECDYPPAAALLPRITRSAIDHEGSTSRDIHNHVLASVHSGSSIYQLDQDLLERLDPDLILTQELCDVCAVSYSEVQRAVRLLALGSPSTEKERRVLSLEPTSLTGIFQTIATVAELAGVPERATPAIRLLSERVDAIVQRTARASVRPKVFAMEWLDPPFVGGHWVPEMVRLAGGVDGLGVEGQYSTTAIWDEIAAYEPDVVVVIPCGFDLARTVHELGHTPLPAQWHALKAVRQGHVYAVNGSAYFNRPGPRIVDGLEILAEILHPDLFPRTRGAKDWQQVTDTKMKG